MEKEDEDVPAGIIVCTRDKDTLVIEWLYTVPEYRGLGIASELMFLAFEEAEASGLKKVAARISEEYEDNDLGWDTWSFFENDVFTGIEEDETE
ncbi:MAG: GNAT family N-acetyltransferase [Lachnospiraceae bacterium]|nr:GNAT family N-acetyltransferase [Lachnospiraceae bacterium]